MFWAIFAPKGLTCTVEKNCVFEGMRTGKLLLDVDGVTL